MIADRGNAVPTCCDSSVPHPSLKLVLKYIQQELSTSISVKCNSYSTPTFCSIMLIMTFDLIIITSCHMSNQTDIGTTCASAPAPIYSILNMATSEI